MGSKGYYVLNRGLENQPEPVLVSRPVTGWVAVVFEIIALAHGTSIVKVTIP